MRNRANICSFLNSMLIVCFFRVHKNVVLSLELIRKLEFFGYQKLLSVAKNKSEPSNWIPSILKFRFCKNDYY